MYDNISPMEQWLFPTIQTIVTVGAIVFLGGRYVERISGHETLDNERFAQMGKALEDLKKDFKADIAEIKTILRYRSRRKT